MSIHIKEGRKTYQKWPYLWTITYDKDSENKTFDQEPRIILFILQFNARIFLYMVLHRTLKYLINLRFLNSIVIKKLLSIFYIKIKLSTWKEREEESK